MDDIDKQVDLDVRLLARRMSSALLTLSKGGDAEELQPVLEDVQEVTMRLLTLIDEGVVQEFVGWADTATTPLPDTVPEDWLEGGP